MGKNKKSNEQSLPKGFSKYRDGIRYRFYLEDGTRVAVCGKSIEECIVKRTQKIDEIKTERQKAIDQGLNPNKRNWTVKEYCDEWIKAKSGTVKAASMRQYTTTVNRIIGWKLDNTAKTFGNLYLEKVETADVRQLQRDIASKISIEAANYTIMILNCIFKMAVGERVILWNPCTVITPLKRTKVNVYDTTHRALSDEDRKAFLDAAKGSHYFNLYIVLLYTALRIGECGALTISDIGEDGLYIKHTITTDVVGKNMIGFDCKTKAGTRFIPLHDEARAAIDRQKAINRMLSNDNVVSITEPIFKAPQGGLLNDTNVNADIARCCRRAKIERFTAHAFRSTCITEWFESGELSLKEWMEMTGHDDVRTPIKRYNHTKGKENKIRAIKAVNW